MRLWPRKRVYIDELPPTHDLRFATIFLLAILGVLGGVYFVGYFAAGDRLPTGTSVDGIDVGGMQRDEARTVLQTRLTPRLTEPVEVTALGHTMRFTPQQIGLTYDLEATLHEGLGGGSWDPRHMWKVVSGGDDVDPVVDVDGAELKAALDRMARRVDEPPVDARVTFAGGVAVEPGHTGVALDYRASRFRLATLLDRKATSVDLAVKSVPGEISTTEAEKFVAAVARPAVASSVQIDVGDDTARIPPAEFAAALRAVQSGSELSLDLDPEALMKLTRPGITASAERRPVDARIVFRDGAPAVVPARPGATLAADQWSAAVLRAVQRPSRKAEASTTPVAPDLSTRDARDLGIRDELSAVEVELDRSVDEEAVTAASESLSGTVVGPGDRFSFLDHVDAEQQAAASLLAGATYELALGTGMADLDRTVSPVSSGLLTDGSDSEVSEPDTDLRWRNDTPYGSYLRSWVRPGTGSDPSVLHVELWSTPFHTVKITTSERYGVVQPGTERDGSSDCRPRSGQPGFSVDVTRQFADDESSGQVETFSSHYAPRDAVVCT